MDDTLRRKLLEEKGMSVENGISPSRRYRVSMMAEDETQVQQTVTLPIGLANNSATVEIWYQKYVPKDHLVVDIEPAEAVEEEPIAAYLAPQQEIVGIGDSLDYVGEDGPAEEEPDEAFSISEFGEEPSEEDDNGSTFVTGVEDSPKEGG